MAGDWTSLSEVITRGVVLKEEVGATRTGFWLERLRFDNFSVVVAAAVVEVLGGKAGGGASNMGLGPKETRVLKAPP